MSSLCSSLLEESKARMEAKVFVRLPGISSWHDVLERRQSWNVIPFTVHHCQSVNKRLASFSKIVLYLRALDTSVNAALTRC